MPHSNLQFQRRLLRPAGLGTAQHEDGLQLVFILVEVDLEELSEMEARDGGQVMLAQPFHQQQEVWTGHRLPV
jgi:hypothetical protein